MSGRPHTPSIISFEFSSPSQSYDSICGKRVKSLYVDPDFYFADMKQNVKLSSMFWEAFSELSDIKDRMRAELNHVFVVM